MIYVLKITENNIIWLFGNIGEMFKKIEFLYLPIIDAMMKICIWYVKSKQFATNSANLWSRYIDCFCDWIEYYYDMHQTTLLQHKSSSNSQTQTTMTLSMPPSPMTVGANNTVHTLDMINTLTKQKSIPLNKSAGNSSSSVNSLDINIRTQLVYPANNNTKRRKDASNTPKENTLDAPDSNQNSASPASRNSKGSHHSFSKTSKLSKQSKRSKHSPRSLL